MGGEIAAWRERYVLAKRLEAEALASPIFPCCNGTTIDGEEFHFSKCGGDRRGLWGRMVDDLRDEARRPKPRPKVRFLSRPERDARRQRLASDRERRLRDYLEATSRVFT